jgi:hypothetical protein
MSAENSVVPTDVAVPVINGAPLFETVPGAGIEPARSFEPAGLSHDVAVRVVRSSCTQSL